MRNVLDLTTIIRSDKLICLKLNLKKGHGYAKYGTFVAQASKVNRYLQTVYSSKGNSTLDGKT